MAKIANMIDSITGADEEAQKQKERFSFLQKMALAKCEEFKSDLEKTAFGDKSKIEIGGGRFFKYYSGQHVDIHSQANERIQETINSFFRGNDEDIKNGFQSLISGALETLINTSSIGEDQEDMFFIYPENNAVVRLDVKAYKYTFTKKGIIADCENIFCR